MPNEHETDLQVLIGELQRDFVLDLAHHTFYSPQTSKGTQNILKIVPGKFKRQNATIFFFLSVSMSLQ